MSELTTAEESVWIGTTGISFMSSRSSNGWSVISTKPTWENRNLLPFCITEFIYDGRELRFKKPLYLTPKHDETKVSLCLQYEQLGIDVFASTREELQNEINEQLAVLWKEYALEDETNLSPAAIKLKKHLLSVITK